MVRYHTPAGDVCKLKPGEKPVVKPCRGIGLTANHSLVVRVWGLGPVVN
jgi:hypothetical protein